MRNHFFYSASTAFGLLALFAGDTLGVEISPTSPRARAAAEEAESARAAIAAPTPAAPSRIRIKLREGTEPSAARDVTESVERRSDVRVESTAPAEDKTQILTLDRAVSDQELSSIAEGLARDPNVEFAVPEKIERAQQVNDSDYPAQWHYHLDKAGIRLPQAWSLSTGKNVVVAVIDTGILSLRYTASKNVLNSRGPILLSLG